MAATLAADSLFHDVPAASPGRQVTGTAAHATPATSRPMSFDDTPEAHALNARIDASRRNATVNIPEYHVKDASNEWNAAHSMGMERARFEVANAGRDLDGDWKADRHIDSALQAFSQHADEADMQARAGKAYQAAKDMGRGPQWREAFDLGKEHVLQRAVFENGGELAQTAVGMLAKDAVGMATEGPVGEAMALRDAAKIAAEAPSVGRVLTTTAAGMAAVGVSTAIVKSALDSVEENPVAHAVIEAASPAGHALDAFHSGVHSFVASGDSFIDRAGSAASQAAAPLTQPVEHAAHVASETVSSYAAPVAQSVAQAVEPLGHAVGEALKPVSNAMERLEQKALTAAMETWLEHGKAALSADEAHQVIKELAHVSQGDTLVIERHGVHLVPAGTKMPDFPVDAVKIPAEELRQGLGIERASQSPTMPVHAASQSAQPAQPSHAALER